MEVILLKDVKNVGKKGELVTVKDGFGRHLLSEGSAIMANAKNQNDLMLQKKREEKEAAKRLADAKELSEKLEKLSISVAVKVGKDGRLFGSVSSKEIADAFLKQTGQEIDKKKIVLAEPLKEIGKTDVTIKLHPEVTGVLHVEVIGE